VAKVNVLGRELEYELISAHQIYRPTLVFLHEGLGCVGFWRDFPHKVAQATGCRTLVFSRQGYGDSDPAPSPRTPRYMHDEALEMLPATLAALDIERPVLVGHSDGGSIALIHAGTYPEAVSGLVVLAPHAWVEEEALAGIRQRYDTVTKFQLNRIDLQQCHNIFRPSDFFNLYILRFYFLFHFCFLYCLLQRITHEG